MRSLAFFLLSTAAFAQAAPHSQSFTWVPSADGGAITLYRASATCESNPTSFTPIKTGIAAPPYTDSTVSVGGWCYYVTTTVQGVESLPSNKITITVLPQAPTSFAKGT